MTTKRKLILRSAAAFGINSSFDLSPEELQEGLDLMNELAAQWDGKTIRVGYNFAGGLDDDAGIPDTAEAAFTLHTAMRWCGNFGKSLSMDKKADARQAFNDLYVSLGRTPRQSRPPQLPMGAGNRRTVMQRQYFPETSEVEGLNDGATEY